MRRYNVGDRFRSKITPGLTAEITHAIKLANGCGTLGTRTVYGAILTYPDGSQAYNSVTGSYFETDWDIVPTFFEVGKTYRYQSNTTISYKVRSIEDCRHMNGDVYQQAVVLMGREGSAEACLSILTRSDFMRMVEVED